MGLKIQVCTPVPNCQGRDGAMHGALNVDWVKARMDLCAPLTAVVQSTWQCGYAVDQARNNAAQLALDNDCDFLFFLDWDVLPHPQTLHQLVQRALNHPECDVFSGVYCCRNRDYPAPLVYAGERYKLTWDWCVGDVLTTESHDVRGCGMGLTLINCDLFRKLSITEKPWFRTSQEFFNEETEDLYFLKRMHAETNSGLLIDTGLLAWHQCPETGLCSGLPFDCLPVRRWREQCRANDANFPSGNVMPYMCDQPRMNIGQKLSGCGQIAIEEDLAHTEHLMEA